MLEDFKAKIEQSFEAWNTGNVDLLDEVFAANVVYHTPPFPDMTGLEAYKRHFVDMRCQYPDLHLTLHEIIAQGNTTVIRCTLHGTFMGPSPAIPIPPTGKAGTAQVCLIRLCPKIT
jgi:predicted ester cyclase